MEGRVKIFDEKKGYGFITTFEGKDYFVHYSSIISQEKFKTLLPDQKVSFQVQTRDGKNEAIHVKVIG